MLMRDDVLLAAGAEGDDRGGASGVTAGFGEIVLARENQQASAALQSGIRVNDALPVRRAPRIASRQPAR